MNFVQKQDLRLVPAAILVWVASFLGVLFTAQLCFLFAIIILFVGVFCLKNINKNFFGYAHVSRIVFSCFAVALVLFIVGLGHLVRTPNIFIELFSQKKTIVLEGAVTSETIMLHTVDKFSGNSRYSYTVDVAKVITKGEKFKVNTSVKVITQIFETTNMPKLVPGEIVEVSGKLLPTSKGDQHTALLVNQLAPSVLSSASKFQQIAANIRDDFKKNISFLPEDSKQLLPGLLIGDRSLMSEDLNSVMQIVSLTHLSAVSGGHIAIFISIALNLGKFLAFSKKLRIFLATLALVSFFVLIQGTPSVMRATVMGLIVLLAKFKGTKTSSAALLSVAVLVLLFLDPWMSHSYAFILSVLAVVGLLIFTRSFSQTLSNWFPVWLANVLAIPIAAQVFCAPVVILLQPIISTYAIVVNVIVQPLFFLCMIFGLATLILGIFFPPATFVTAWLAGILTLFLAKIARFFASLPAAALPWPEGFLGMGLYFFFTAIFLIFWLMIRRRL